jgi:uncharacterized membrane protein YeaQ/YmgE (transglycosylase-associated protein family)
MGIISWILVGLVAGVLANLIYPGKSQGGWIAAMLLGIVGAIVGGFVAGLLSGQDWVTGFNLSSIAVAVIGAVIVLFGYNALARPRHA